MEEKDMAKNCSNCNNAENQGVTVPYVVHESAMARAERIIKRQWIAIILLICLLFGSFGLFVWYESQFETISYDYTQDGEGTNIIGDRNEVNNGAEIESESEAQAQE
jgi:hypothetical protein